MADMTPLESIVLSGTMVYARDFAGHSELKAICPTEADAEWVATSLAAYHHVEVYRLPQGKGIVSVRWTV